MTTTIQVPAEAGEFAREQALAALAQWQRVTDYFRKDSDFAGALFLAIEPNEPDRFTAADLFAVSTLNVKIPERGARRLLLDAGAQEEVSMALRSLADVSLEDAEDEHLHTMRDVYDVVKSTLRKHSSATSNPWVTASKLMARKRPHLYPVRDRKVASYLGLSRLEAVEQEYALFRQLMGDAAVVHELGRLREHLEGEDGVILEDSPLRLLDAALWRAA